MLPQAQRGSFLIKIGAFKHFSGVIKVQKYYIYIIYIPLGSLINRDPYGALAIPINSDTHPSPPSSHEIRQLYNRAILD